MNATATAAPAIAVRGLTKTYGRTVAVQGLDFEVSPGTVTGFLGPNGAGKTTTMRLLLGLTRPDAGHALVLGTAYRDIPGPARRVGALVDGLGFHPGRTARAHLTAVALQTGSDPSRVGELLETVDLSGAADRRVGGFSLGMRQRLGLASALIGDPELLLLDEPANGLDPAGIRWMRSFLRAFAASGGTVFVSSHVLSEMAQLVDEVVVVRAGRLLTHTTVDTLMAGDEVVVRAADPDRLARALVASGAGVDRLGEGRLRITGVDAEHVGQASLDEGVALSELITQGHSLEEVFLQLTNGDTT